MDGNVSIGPEIDTIIWDLDGTILDSFDYSYELWCEVLARNAIEIPSKDLFARNYHGSVHDTARGLAPGVTDDMIAKIIDDFFVIDNVHIDEVDEYLFQDAQSLLTRAHEAGLRQIIVTNRPHGTDRGNASPRNMIANSSLDGLVDQVICGDEVVERKPSMHAVDGIHIQSEKTIVIGDQSVDGAFAANLGCRAFIVCRTNEHKELHTEELQKEHCTAISSLNDIAIE